MVLISDTFRRGDILINRVISEQPFVLNDIHTWGSKEMLENGYSEEDGMVKNADRTVERLMKKGDTSDMNYSGSYIGEDVRNGFYIFLLRYSGTICIWNDMLSH